MKQTSLQGARIVFAGKNDVDPNMKHAIGNNALF